MAAPNDLVFFDSPDVAVGTNTFRNVPVILKYEADPLIKVIKEEDVGFTTEIRIFHSDGTYLAKVVGSRLFATGDGKKSDLRVRHPDKMTVCELNGQVLFEIRRTEAAALRTEAELYAPDGVFIRASSKDAEQIVFSRDGLKIAGVTMKGCLVQNWAVGIHLFANGRIAIGDNLGRKKLSS